MKITRGFVAITPDGAYLYMSSQQTRTGHHVYISEVADINDASVRVNPGPRDRKEMALLVQRKVTWVPVEVRREVVLQARSTAT